jgi:hypothetical protein
MPSVLVQLVLIVSKSGIPASAGVGKPQTVTIVTNVTAVTVDLNARTRLPL